MNLGLRCFASPNEWCECSTCSLVACYNLKVLMIQLRLTQRFIHVGNHAMSITEAFHSFRIRIILLLISLIYFSFHSFHVDSSISFFSFVSFHCAIVESCVCNARNIRNSQLHHAPWVWLTWTVNKKFWFVSGIEPPLVCFMKTFRRSQPRFYGVRMRIF